MRKTKRLLTTLLFCFSLLSAQAHDKKTPILVRDAETLLPLPGVTIENISKKEYSFTLEDGSFDLQVEEKETIQLRLSYLGYQEQFITIEGTTIPETIDLHIEENVLDGIVITGYTKQSKGRTTGAVGKIEAKALNQLQVSSMDQALQGQVPGLYVASPSGQPGTPGRGYHPRNRLLTR